RFRQALASQIFPLTRVTRIFQKRIFTKTAPNGPGGDAAAGFLLPHASAPHARMVATYGCRQEAAASAVPLFPDCYLQWLLQLQRVGGRAEGSRALKSDAAVGPAFRLSSLRRT